MRRPKRRNCPTGQDDCQGEVFCNFDAKQKIFLVDGSEGFVTPLKVSGTAFGLWFVAQLSLRMASKAVRSGKVRTETKRFHSLGIVGSGSMSVNAILHQFGFQGVADVENPSSQATWIFPKKNQQHIYCILYAMRHDWNG
jgi:hypothetical protein